LTIYYKTYEVIADTEFINAGADLVLAIKDSQSYTYIPEIYRQSDIFPLGKTFIAKSTYFNVNKKLLIDPYAYENSPRTEALIVYKHPDNQWKITNEKKVILGDTCIKATGKVRGIETIAWFSPKLPAGFGIYHYVGLPGTILETWMVEKNIQIIAVHIEYTSPDIIEPTYFRRISEKTYFRKRDPQNNPKVYWKEKDFIN
jgi:GLPGLI family protein